MDMNKRGGMELSMSTIVIIVIAIIILIFGIIFGRNIMCSGIRATDAIDTAVMNQIRDLFGSDTIGVSCQGEEGSYVKLATGRRVSIVCGFKVQDNLKYSIKVDDPMILSGSEREKPLNKAWILTRGWDGYVKPGSIVYQPILTLKLPSDAPKNSVIVDIDVTNVDTGVIDSKTIMFDIEPLNFIQTTMC